MTIIQLRRGTAAEWTSANPVLNEGEQGLEKDTGKMKIGDGISNWAALPYFVTGGAAAYGDPTVVLNAGEALPADIPEGAVVLRRSAAGGGGDHNALQNLTVGNPHTQYALAVPLLGHGHFPALAVGGDLSPHTNHSVSGWSTMSPDYPWFTAFYLPRTMSFDRMSVRSNDTGSGRSIKFGVWTADSTTGLPATVVADSGAISADTAAIFTATINITLTSGLYWVGCYTNASILMERLGGGGIALRTDEWGVWNSMTSGAFPAGALPNNPAGLLYGGQALVMKLRRSA